MRTSLAPIALAALLLGTLLAGCSSQPVDVSKGNYGKADTTTQLPPQPNAQEIIKQRSANPAQGTGQPAAR